ncbi:MAG: ATP-binding protein [bacterium]
MTDVKKVIQRIPGYNKVVRIPLANITNTHAINEVLQESFDTCFENGYSKIIVDLTNVQFPSSSLIATLISATSRARNFKGDVKIVNLSHSAKNNLATFSPLSFLSLEKDEAFALQEFQLSEMEPPPANIITEDIVEDPLIEKLQETVNTMDSEHVEVDLPESEPDTHESDHLRVRSMAKNLYTICDFVTDYAEKAGFNAKEIGKAKIAVYEACLNIIEHAYHSNPDNWIDVWVEFDSQKFTVIIQDYGVGFEGFNTKDYDVLSAMDHRKTGGFGLYIIRRSMDEVEYQADKVRGNRMKLVKYI